MADILGQLVDKLKKTYGDRLVSVVLYGSAAVGDHHNKFSDFNVFCVLSRITTVELEESGPIFNWWRERDNPAPMLFALDEVAVSTDCFPIEFHDMKERHRILYGQDVVADLEIDDSFYRAQVEFELRAKLLRLRQKAAGVLSDKDLLLRLMADSVSTFAVLTRHVLRLHGLDATWQKREIAAQAQEKLGIDPEPFLTLLNLREGKIKPKNVEAVALFDRYLRQIQALAAVADRLAK